MSEMPLGGTHLSCKRPQLKQCLHLPTKRRSCVCVRAQCMRINMYALEAQCYCGGGVRGVTDALTWSLRADAVN